jgi:4-hydroxyacetophenone monooxygenase
MALENAWKRLEVRQPVFEDYMERTARKREQFVWSTPYGTTYFRNSKGKVTTNSPWSLFEMWNWHREPDTQHFLHE